MKTSLKCFLACAVLTMVSFSCNKEDDSQMPRSDNDSEVFSDNFFPVYTMYNWSEHQDGFPGISILCWEGAGSEPRFGNFSVKLAFCCDLSTGCYKDAEGYFEVNNGDKLYFYLLDGVITDYSEGDSDYYQKCLKELGVIKGGTGIFKDAGGRFLSSIMIHINPGVWQADGFSHGYLSLTLDKSPKGDDLAPHLFIYQ